MTVTPTGSPLWLRTVAHTDYGGHASKENFLSRGSINPLTDISAEEWCRHAADTAAAGRTAPFAIITFLNNDAVPAAPTVESVHMMTGVRLTSYAGGSAPTGFPSASRSNTGHTIWTFASSYLDEYGISGAYVPRSPKASAHGSVYVAPTATVSGQTVIVRCYDVAGSLIGDKRITLAVW